jgi:hypothetical protein
MFSVSHYLGFLFGFPSCHCNIYLAMILISAPRAVCSHRSRLITKLGFTTPIHFPTLPHQNLYLKTPENSILFCFALGRFGLLRSVKSDSLPFGVLGIRVWSWKKFAISQIKHFRGPRKARSAENGRRIHWHRATALWCNNVDLRYPLRVGPSPFDLPLC